MKRSLGLQSTGIAIAALLCGTAQGSALADGAELGWQAVPEQELAELRGGLDLGSLVASFAIQRVVRIDGQIVAQTELLISGLDRIWRGGLPDAQVLGNLANQIRIGLGDPGADAANAAIESASAGAAAAAASVAATTDAARAAAASASADAAAAAAAAAATVAAATSPSSGGASPGGAPGGAGTVTSSTQASSNRASDFGPGLSQAVAVATGGNLPQGATPVNVAVVPPGTGAAATAPPTVAAGPAAAQPSSAGAAAAAIGALPVISISVPVGPGRIVVSGIPNASTLATAIQNSVQATRIETETRISASLASLAALRSAGFAAALRQQAIDAVRR